MDPVTLLPLSRDAGDRSERRVNRPQIPTSKKVTMPPKIAPWSRALLLQREATFGGYFRCSMIDINIYPFYYNNNFPKIGK